ncbi:hypothetical protein [Bifidobacterium choloepi]|uniref:Uncharacterized protein n=1 Tax=Bifidobacterium choloepi TaxID=2614131 RepID=A0A6I5NJD5_9BIFI|nr:hypothetical protein [Bifidobacterium choloepi]NEG70493.1 hypothetical protein [Bifidobacterium choloepi]
MVLTARIKDIIVKNGERTARYPFTAHAAAVLYTLISAAVILPDPIASHNRLLTWLSVIVLIVIFVLDEVGIYWVRANHDDATTMRRSRALVWFALAAAVILLAVCLPVILT